MTNSSTDNSPINEKNELSQTYRARGFQQQSLDDYLAVQKLQEQKKSFRMPVPLQFILTTPFILLFCLGLIFIPFMFYLFFTSLQ